MESLDGRSYLDPDIGRNKADNSIAAASAVYVLAAQ